MFALGCPGRVTFSACKTGLHHRKRAFSGLCLDFGVEPSPSPADRLASPFDGLASPFARLAEKRACAYFSFPEAYLINSTEYTVHSAENYSILAQALNASPPSPTWLGSMVLVELLLEGGFANVRFLRFSALPNIQCPNVAFYGSNVGDTVKRCDVEVVGVRANDVERVSDHKPKPVQAQAIKARTAKFKLRYAGQAVLASPSDKSGCPGINVTDPSCI
ncbi:hypothetical protein B0H13DRAFT_1892124 [Mycena leptocephala]|nr:hypothetical protein B0H13DRAFT_1892124 [Mycena leptocephala]